MLLVFTMILGRLRGSFGGTHQGWEPTSRQLKMDPQMEHTTSNYRIIEYHRIIKSHNDIKWYIYIENDIENDI